MMLVDQVKTKRIKGVQRLKQSIARHAVSLRKAHELVLTKSEPAAYLISVPTPIEVFGYLEFISLFAAQIRPFHPEVDFLIAHMSGLRGLFVWKQKATTDAPDTYTA